MANKRSIFGAISTLLTISLVAILCWHFLGRPQSVDEGLETLQTAGKNAKDKFDEWNITSLGDFADVLQDGLNGLDFGSFFDNDPRVGDNTTILWRDFDPGNGGLRLTLLNALDDDWTEEFELAVADWQESDALVLSTERVEVDHTCQSKDGVMVVCNANFGETGWVGINENSIVNDRIVASVSKMNEYYLKNSNLDHRRYTMCHEIGHGFGLPHTDENPYNSNLGNCLDYTDDPDQNLHPGEVNFNKLRNMYLTNTERRVEKRYVRGNEEEEIEEERIIITRTLEYRG
mmetsp:Transcript_19712/g.41394  ORF Transcript_19712/g.41394 Transcript_19712/m.41394 type:complete len:289 (-) Transcript_19712:230-1096(-)